MPVCCCTQSRRKKAKPPYQLSITRTITKEDATTIVSKVNLTLFSRILPVMVKENGEDRNMVTCPFSLFSIMVMLHAGAAGKTAMEVKDVLGLPDDVHVLYSGFREALELFNSSNEFMLEAANRIYTQIGIKFVQDYLDFTKNVFQASAESLDFSKSEEARGVITRWVEKQTHDKIKNLIPPGALDEFTRIVLVNAIYFKGSWLKEFEKSDTKEEDFYISESKAVKVSMMSQTTWFAIEKVKSLGCTVLQMPYKGDRLEMLLFLSDSPEGFNSMERKFGSFNFIKLTFEDVKAVVSIPKFKILTNQSLVKMLMNVGIIQLFDQSADFSKTSKNTYIYVSHILQRTFVEMNEEGTEAAVAIAVSVMGCNLSDLNEPLQFKCNRPFLFVIRDIISDLVIFNGRVMNPNE